MIEWQPHEAKGIVLSSFSLAGHLVKLIRVESDCFVVQCSVKGVPESLNGNWFPTHAQAGDVFRSCVKRILVQRTLN